MGAPIEGPSRSGSDPGQMQQTGGKILLPLVYNFGILWPVPGWSEGTWALRNEVPSAVGGQREGVRLTHWYNAREDQTEGCRVSIIIYYIMYTNLKEHTCTLAVRSVLKWMLKLAQLPRMSSDGGDSKGWIRPPIFSSFLDPWLSSRNFFKFRQPAKTNAHLLRVTSDNLNLVSSLDLVLI